MTPKPNTISTLDQMGYTVGVAHGATQPEEEALAAATANSLPAQIAVDAATVAAQTVGNLQAKNAIEPNIDPRELAAKIATEIAGKLQTVRTEEVEWRERALAIAQASPTVFHIDGPGVSAYVAAKDDGTGWDDAAQETIDLLADQAAFNERIYQVDHQDEMSAMSALLAAGHEVARQSPGDDTFIVDGKAKTGTELLTLAAAINS